jgi:hypothetical protein
MIGFLRAILEALRDLAMGQKSLSDQVNAFQGDIDTTLAAQAAAIEHLRVLIEGDELPATVGVPTFAITSIPTGGNQ